MAKSTLLQLDEENKQLIVYYGLDTCENCKQLMIPTHGDAKYLPKNLTHKFATLGIHLESYDEWNVCNECLKRGGYPKECDICSGEFSFPSEFSFQVEFWPQYTDDDTTYQYICKQCHATRAQEVIDKLLRADEVKDLRKGL